MENRSSAVKVEMGICSNCQKCKGGICYYIYTKEYRLDNLRDRVSYRLL